MKLNYLLKAFNVTFIMLLSTVFTLVTQQAIAKESYSITGVSTQSSLNLRKFPGTKSRIIAKIPASGSVIRLNNKEVYNGSSTWIQVRSQGKTGWVNQRFLKLTGQSVSGSSASGQHTHPRNECTRSINHAHPNGNKSHAHRYSCKKSASTNKANSHSHPKNRCTRSVTHNHPNGKRTHSHRYSCKNNQAATNVNAHTHPKNKCTRSVTHSHPNGKRTHTHRYSCKGSGKGSGIGNGKQTAATDPNAHTHPRKKCTRSVTHTHPNGKRTHAHRYSCR